MFYNFNESSNYQVININIYEYFLNKKFIFKIIYLLFYNSTLTNNYFIFIKIGNISYNIERSNIRFTYATLSSYSRKI